MVAAVAPGPAGTIMLRRRPAALALATAAVAGFLAYMALEVPVLATRPPHGVLRFCPLAAPPVPHAEAVRHWPAALLAAVFVASAGALVLAAVTARRRRVSPRPPRAAARQAGLPRPLGLQRVPARVALATAAASGALAAAGALQGYRLWVTALLVLAPWLPVLFVEGIWKYEHYGFYALFVAIVLLQIGHMGEHTVQVTQLLMSHGTLARSHGVFGQLDFETVHFFWDSAIWLSLCLLLYRFPRGNPWLWAAFAAASLHEVEHVYLYWLYNAHRGFYLAGGFEGIMGYDGVIGTPLARPYLHFAYNFLVVVPMALALWDETLHVCDHVLAGALRGLPREQLAAATLSSRRLAVPAAGLALEPGALYVVSHGELRTPRRLGPGDSLEPAARLAVAGARRTELLVIDPPPAA